MSSDPSSPVSVQLCDETDFSEYYDQIHQQSKSLQGVEFVTPSQIDPLGEFSQMPEAFDDFSAESEEDEDYDDDDFVPGFNTQLTDLKDDDYFDFRSQSQNVPKYNKNVWEESEGEEDQRHPGQYGTDGYIRYKIPEISESTSSQPAIELIRNAKRIVIVSGAGISVSAGIPDFRSEGRGLYALLGSWLSGARNEQSTTLFGGLKEWQLDALQRLDEPESLFDLEFFLHDPHPFYSFLLSTRFGAPTAARFAPTPCHWAISALPNLLLSFTQNIDTLEAAAGIAQVCYCHGSFESVSCVKCHRSHSIRDFWQLLEMYSDCDANDCTQNLPLCQYCLQEDSDSDEDSNDNDFLPLLKPDIVFFGENLPANFFAHIRSTLPSCDLLICTGTSMKVLPVASIPDLIPPTIPQILINKEPILDHNFDLELLGEADCVWSWIAAELKLKPKSKSNNNNNSTNPNNNNNNTTSVTVSYEGNGRYTFHN